MNEGGNSGSTEPPAKQAAILVLGKTASTLAEIVTPLLLVRVITKADLIHQAEVASGDCQRKRRQVGGRVVSQDGG